MASLPLLLLAVAGCASTAATTTPIPTSVSEIPTNVINDTCDNLMQDYSISSMFTANVAHAIHSITLDDLREFFEPDAPEDNHIPNVNLDLMSTHPVLYSAPKSGVDPRIKTSGLRVLDQVLSHMDNEAYDMKNYSVLERVAHIMHMREMYANVQPIYQALKDKPPPNPEVICHCINDIESNGVKDTLYFIALKIREPNVMTNIVLRMDGNHAYMYDGKDLSAESDNRHSFSIKYRLFRRPRRPAEPGTKYKFKSKYKYQSHRRRRRSLLFVNPDSIVDNPDKYEDEMPALVSEKAWKFWKEQSLDTDEQMNYDIAMFLYCTLNH